MRRSAIDLSSECSLLELSCITDAVKNLPSGGNFLEIGTAAGGTLKEIIKAADFSNLQVDFYVIDPFNYFPNQVHKIHQNLLHSKIDPSRVKFWEGTTNDYLSVAIEKKLEFTLIFIDGDHKEFPVMNDLRWMAFLADGGLIFIHDYSKKFPGVVWSVDRFLAKNKNFSIISHVDNLVVIRREGKLHKPVNRRDLFASKYRQTYKRLGRSIKKRLVRM